MYVLVTYDVNTVSPEGQKRLRRVAQICLDFGQRVQESVFECSVTDLQYERLKQRLVEAIDPSVDSLRLYWLPGPRERFRECFGVQRDVNFHAPLVL
jgi:CRISPR-associated protein Cas2